MSISRVLVTYGSKHGGTAEIATAIAASLRAEGLTVDCTAASHVRDLDAYDAFVIGSGLYIHRWAREATRFVIRHEAELRTRPVWMFSSGPLDDSAQHRSIPPVPRVAGLMARVGANGHATFGGRIARDAKGFIASRMAKANAGDWRNWEQITGWARDIAHHLTVAPQRRRLMTAPSRWLVATLCLATAITAIGGGATLLASPDGALMHTPTTALAHSPFTSFLVPGLILLFVVGFGNAIAGALVLRHARHANTAVFLAGAVLFGWIVGEMVMLRTINALQVVYFATSLVLLGAAVRHHQRDRARWLMRASLPVL